MLLPLVGFYTIGGFYNSSYTHLIGCRKDALYRLKNCPWIPWRLLLFSFGRRFINLTQRRGQATEEDKPKCLIFDDTTLGKSGKAIEFIGKVWDHVQHGYILGFKLLTMGFWDGKSLLPIDFSLHREKGRKKSYPFGLKPKERKAQYSKKRSKDASSIERIKELDEKKTDVVLWMISRVLKMGFRADYVLVDSWFFCFELLRLSLLKRMHLIAMAKMGKMNLVYNAKTYSPKALLQMTTRKSKFCSKLKTHYIELIVNYKGCDIKIFFTRYGHQKNWHLIICSNTKLTFCKTLEIYQIRWSVEVLFKETKQFLGLGKCQSNDFDAHLAHVTICFMLYMALALKKRFDYQESIGHLFQTAKARVLQTTLAEKIWKFFLKMAQKIIEIFEINPIGFMKKIFNFQSNDRFFNILLAEFG